MLRLRCAAIVMALATLSAARATATEVHVHGLIDVVAAERGASFDHNVLSRGDSPFDPYGVGLFVDAIVRPDLQVFTQMVLRDASSLYVDGAYLAWTPWKERDLHVQAGKIPWPIGTWAPRTYSNKNPLIGAPLMYQYHSTLLWYEVVPSADALLGAAGTGQYGVDYFGYTEGRGMPLVDDSYWDVGVTVIGSFAPLEVALGVTAGTPGWGSTSQDENSGKSLLGRVGVAPLPGLRVGVSAPYGPYLVQSLDRLLPEGRSVNDYRQRLGMADLEWLWGRLEARSEAAFNVWETPMVGDLEVKSGYLELKLAFPAGWFVAGRWDALRFGEIADSLGGRRSWDSDVTRIESGAGYRFDRNVVAKLVHQHTTLERETRDDRTLSLVGAQLSVSF